MRTAIQQKLVNSIPEIGARVLDPHAAGAGTVKPYLVVRQGAEAEKNSWTGFQRIFEVWPYEARTSTFQSLDTLVQKVEAALDRQSIATAGGGGFNCRYLGTVGTDLVDTDLDAITRGLQFAALALQPVAVPETAGSDLWLEALALWTEGLLGTGWTVYRNVWPPDYICPSVLWRVTGVEVKESARASYEVRKKFTGHVMGGTPNTQLACALTLAQELGNCVKLELDGPNRRYLSVISPALDYGADWFSTGQLSVVMSRIANRPAEEAPLMAAVHNVGLIE